MPVALAGILSFLLEPIVVRLERLALPRQLAVAVVLVAVLLIGAAIVGVVADQAGRLAQALPAYEGNLRNKIHALTHPSLIGGVWQDAFHSLQALETELFPAAAPGTEAPAPAAAVQQPATRILSYLMAFIPTAGTIFLVGILTLFLLLQYRDLRTRLVRLMGESEIGRSAQALDDIGSDLGDYFLLQAILNSAFGAAITGALWLIGLPAFWLWGILAATLRFIPYAGSFIAAALPTIVAVTIDPGWWFAIGVVSIFIVSEAVTGQLIEPLWIGHRTRISPIGVVAGAAFWAWLWGPVGLFLATPLTLGLTVLGHHVPRLSPFAVLLGNEPALSEAEHFYHRLLSGEAWDAASAAEDSIRAGRFAAYMGEVITPALAGAARDVSADILGAPQAARVIETLGEFVDFAETFDADAREDGDKPAKPSDSLRIAVIGGRGAFDHVCARLIALCFRREPDVAAMIGSMPGLNGLMSFRDEAPDAMLLVTVGGCSLRQLDFIARKAGHLFPQAQLRLGYLADDAQAARTRAAHIAKKPAYSASEIVEDGRRALREALAARTGETSPANIPTAAQSG